ncbi:MAG: hypothetical protein ACSHYF_10860 [Verrucomicrobiaceae bacterium]
MPWKFPPRTLGFLSYLLALNVSLAQDGISWASVELNAAPVTTAGDAPVTLDLQISSHPAIAPDSLDHNDLFVTNASGFHAPVQFLAWAPIDPIPGEEPHDLSQDIIATYQLDAPRGGWTREHNGEYAVLLTGGEISLADATTIPLTLAGSFKVAIEKEQPPIPALAGTITVETFPTPGAPGGNESQLAVAQLTATFPTPVNVSWSQVQFDSAGNFTINVEASPLGDIVPQVVTTYEHRIELGMLDPGSYQVRLRSGDKDLAETTFIIPGSHDDLIKALPSKVAINIRELPTLGLRNFYAANITLTYNEYVAEIHWGEPRQDGTTLQSSVTTWINPAVDLIAPVVIEHQLFLGTFDPGDYQYRLSSLEKVIGEANFTVTRTGGGGDVSPPRVEVTGAEVNTPGEEALEFQVHFSDPSELVISGIEAQQLTAMNRQGQVFPLERTDLAVTADFSAGAIATYRMEPPGGSWDVEDRGRYQLLLSQPELVADTLGNHLLRPLIGHLTVNIHPEDPEPVNTSQLTIVNNELIGRWTAQVRLFVPEDLAARDNWAVDWGRIHPVGPSFFLRPVFHRAGSKEPIGIIPPSDTTGAGQWIEHHYDLGPISSGLWLVCLESNLGHFAKGHVEAGSPDGEEPFDFWTTWTNPADGALTTNRFWEYCVGTNPADQSDDHLGDPKPEIITAENGDQHLGLRCRMALSAIDARMRFQGSHDLTTWNDLGPDQIEEISREQIEGGLEEFVVCLRADVRTSNFRYLRAIAERW